MIVLIDKKEKYTSVRYLQKSSDHLLRSGAKNLFKKAIKSSCIGFAERKLIEVELYSENNIKTWIKTKSDLYPIPVEMTKNWFSWKFFKLKTTLGKKKAHFPQHTSLGAFPKFILFLSHQMTQKKASTTCFQSILAFFPKLNAQKKGSRREE